MKALYCLFRVFLELTARLQITVKLNQNGYNIEIMFNNKETGDCSLSQESVGNRLHTTCKASPRKQPPEKPSVLVRNMPKPLPNQHP